MANYDIYGIGGALVDIEAEVSDEFLRQREIDKGVMTLVDESKQENLLEALKIRDTQLEKKCGGSVCNSVVAAAMLGATTFFSGKVADDHDGDLYISDLNQAGVNFHSARPEPGVTGKCLVMVTSDAERTMNTFLGVSENLTMREIDKQALKNSEWLYLEGYMVSNEQGVVVAKSTLEFAKANGVKIAISLSDPIVANVFGETLRDLLSVGVDLIFCNIDEALAFTGTNNLEAAAAILIKYTKTFVITKGADGAVVYDGNSLIHSKGIDAKAIDTNGAGDMFAGAFLYGITSGKDYRWAAELANDCAARIVAHFGPRLNLDEFNEIRMNFGI